MITELKLKNWKSFRDGTLYINPVPSHMRNYVPFSETLQPDGSNIAGVLAALVSSHV